MYSIKKKYNDLISPLKRNFLLEGKESKYCIYFGVGVYRIVLKTSTVRNWMFQPSLYFCPSVTHFHFILPL